MRLFSQSTLSLHMSSVHAMSEFSSSEEEENNILPRRGELKLGSIFFHFLGLYLSLEPTLPFFLGCLVYLIRKKIISCPLRP